MPLLRDLRQTLASVRARLRTPVEAVLLTGGTARLPGLADYLAEELELPVQLWTGRRPEAVPQRRRGADPVCPPGRDTRFALCTAAAWAGARGSKQIDLRRGPFVYKASLSILRQKAAHLGALAAAMIICITVDATMALARLRGERDQLQAQLKSQTQELFGEPRLDGRQVATLLQAELQGRDGAHPQGHRLRPAGGDLAQGATRRRDQAGHHSSSTSGPRRCSSAARSTRRRRSMSCRRS